VECRTFPRVCFVQGKETGSAYGTVVLYPHIRASIPTCLGAEPRRRKTLAMDIVVLKGRKELQLLPEGAVNWSSASPE
jgi:hypothetical protein